MAPTVASPLTPQATNYIKCQNPVTTLSTSYVAGHRTRNKALPFGYHSHCSLKQNSCDKDDYHDENICFLRLHDLLSAAHFRYGCAWRPESGTRKRITPRHGEQKKLTDTVSTAWLRYSLTSTPAVRALHTVITDLVALQ